jgi:hypothetical protein
VLGMRSCTTASSTGKTTAPVRRPQRSSDFPAPLCRSVRTHSPSTAIPKNFLSKHNRCVIMPQHVLYKHGRGLRWKLPGLYSTM